jgi:YD repeat-containing protein
MYIKLTFAAILATLQPLNIMGDELPSTASYQSDAAITNKIFSGEKSSMTDREKAGLRGPVQQCTEERTNPAFENFPATSYVSINKYSRDGRILQVTTSNSIAPSQTFSTTFAYDPTGRLLKQTITNPGLPAVESKYNYDDTQRLTSITGNAAQTSTFEYDDQGHKIRIQSLAVKPDSAVLVSTAVSFSVPETDDPYVPIPAGGHAKTLFNESDQPVEWKISDANGNLTNRLIRTYDANGRLAEVRYTIENILPTLPAESQQQLMAEPGAAEELMQQLTKLLGEQRDFIRATYTYDADGRLIEKHEHMGPSMEMITKTVYNDHSDKLEEHTITIGEPNPPKDGEYREVSSSAPPSSQQTEVRYSYKYDTFGNWTEQAISSPTSPNNVTSVTRRTIVYY